MTILDRLAGTRLVAILRATTPDHLTDAAEILVSEGLDCVELPLTTPGALTALADIRDRLGDAVALGAGTVLTSTQAADAVAAGATYLISPAVGADVIGWAVEHGVDVLPGALTPTEIHAAHGLGARAVKLFPAGAVGPGYLTALRGPWPDLRIVATGGVDRDNARAWLAAGALALGVGSPLAGDALETGNLAGLRARARAWKETLT
ncbi:bifunctional 4-hydroxy-2-oxoglutarate aldolase/2-dehydro-3-deoxy-phosphogluconate aldolase [Longispora sp. K20-0274]|uniref:bifunctional 4-hydroxy-2-oxoglutarate aldolase/2-dehydro-3-deoxy-phosphogluconate aldolase n=1 Tax=Longispora sp. K20-0274 TaxID=3088255 RepID=UPI00399B5254